MKKLLAFALLLCAAVPAATPTPSGPWDAAVRGEIITKAEREVGGYFFQDRIQSVREALEAKRSSLVSIEDPEKFAEAMTKVLYGVTHDKHLNVGYSPEAQRTAAKPTAADRARGAALDSYLDFAYDLSARLHGNIGYLRIEAFVQGPAALRMLDDAMGTVAHTDALIIDLRGNHGGEPDTVNYLLGYFFAPHTQVTGFLERHNGKVVTEPHYTPSQMVRARYLDKPVYVLTDSETFSGGEQFAYDMQTLKRATLIGVTTGGGANPGDFHPLTENFAIFIPFGSAHNPITGTNWEGVGVKPEVETTSKGALLEAYTRALKAANNPLSFAVAGRTHALADPAKALTEALPDH